MKVSILLRPLAAGAAGAVMLAGLTAATQAAPMIAAEALSGEARPAPMLDRVVYDCRWRNGMRQCSWVGPAPPAYQYYYGYGYGPGYYYGPGLGYGDAGHPPPEAFPTGSTRWWREMDYEGRGGFGNGGR